MSDRIDPSTRPEPRGPWPAVTNLDHIYDPGRGWCVHRDAHPDQNNGYPADTHTPDDECRTAEYYLKHISDAATKVDGCSGDADGLSVYCASPFRFGEPRATSTAAAPGTASRSLAPYLVLETWTEPAGREDTCGGDASVDALALRVRLSLGEALRLARIIEHLVDTVTLDRRCA